MDSNKYTIGEDIIDFITMMLLIALLPLILVMFPIYVVLYVTFKVSKSVVDRLWNRLSKMARKDVKTITGFASFKGNSDK